MKFIFRWAFRLLILVIVLVVAGILLLDTIVRSLMESRIRAETGMDVKITRVNVGLASPTFTVEGFKLYNPAEFGGLPFLDLPELHLEYDREAAQRGKLRFKLVRVNLAEISVVKNQKGQLNIAALAALENKNTNQTQQLEFEGIDVLNLTLGKLNYVDLTNPALNRELRMGLNNEIVNNVRTAADLMNVMLKILMQNGQNPLGQSLFNPGNLLKHQPAPRPTNAPPVQPVPATVGK